MPRAQAGVATAVAATSRQVGSSLGIAVIGATVASEARPAAWWIIAAAEGASRSSAS